MTGSRKQDRAWQILRHPRAPTPVAHPSLPYPNLTPCAQHGRGAPRRPRRAARLRWRRASARSWAAGRPASRRCRPWRSRRAAPASAPGWTPSRPGTTPGARGGPAGASARARRPMHRLNDVAVARSKARLQGDILTVVMWPPGPQAMMPVSLAQAAPAEVRLRSTRAQTGAGPRGHGARAWHCTAASPRGAPSAYMIIGVSASSPAATTPAPPLRRSLASCAAPRRDLRVSACFRAVHTR